MKVLPRRAAFIRIWLTCLLILGSSIGRALHAQSVDIPSKTWGVSFGNSKSFTGLRFNFRDHRVERVTGVNVTLWAPRDVEQDRQGAVIRGLSLGLIPGGGDVRGVQIGILGAMAMDDLVGINIGGVGVGGRDLEGVFTGLAMIRVEKGGRLTGLAATSFNHIQGTLNGLSVGIVNYAWTIEKGIQLGLVNIVRDNPKGLRVLPVFTADFR